MTLRLTRIGEETLSNGEGLRPGLFRVGLPRRACRSVFN